MRLKWILAAIAGLLVTAGLAGFLMKDRLFVAAIDHFASPYIGDRPAFTHEFGDVIELDLPMRDGVELATRVHLPEGEGPWPTVLVRDPYQFTYYLTCHFYVRYGYACVHQDVRGQGESGGEWYPLRHETADGEDTLDWLVEQDWQDGNVALVGASYVGLVQWAVADRLPPEVKTVVISVSHGDFYDMVYRGGHFAQAVAGLWAAEIFYPLDEKAEAAEIWQTEVLPARPALDVDPGLFGEAWPSYHDYLRHPERSDPYWQQEVYRTYREAHRNLDRPALLIGRWQDFFLEGMLERFDALPMRAQSVFVIQPGEHGGNTNDLDYPDPQNQDFGVSLRWLDHHLRGAALPEDLSPGYLYYRIGEDRWTHADNWPPQTASRRFRLAGLSGAARCEGRLQPGDGSPPDASAHYVYDPDDPVPTRGGSFMLNPNLAPVAVAEQGQAACDRDDVLSFLTDAFDAPSRIAGTIEVRIDVASDAEDSAFTVKLSEVFADGRVLNIRDDITSLSFRNGSDTRLRYTPGEPVELVFPLTPIDWTLQPGSRLRLDISSSNSPAFPPHPNRAGLWSEIGDVQTANQTLSGGSVTLPLGMPEADANPGSASE